MKMIGLMSLLQYRESVRKYFEKHEIQIYSELEVNGHTSDTVEKFGWWVFEDTAIQSVLFFAIVEDDKADDIMTGIAELKTEFDPGHPPKAFQLNVEKLV